MRYRCQSFLISLFKQLKQRLPENLILFKNVSLFSVSNILQPVKNLRNYCEVREYLAIPKNIIASAESQLQNINLVKWINNTETEKFWAEVEDFQNASWENPFLDLFNCAKQALILPHSNADVERVFSAMNCAKNKLRSSMKIKLLNAILIIRFGLVRKKQCCMFYKLPDSVVKKIGTAEAYKNPPEETVTTTLTSTEISFFNIQFF